MHKPSYPSWKDTEVLDDFFIKGRNMWPDLKELRDLRLDRSKVSDEVVTFIRSTALNEHGIVHYVRAYLRSYGDDYKLGIWAAMWGGEEYLHSIVLRTILKALGEKITQGEMEGLETGSYAGNYDDYLVRTAVSPLMDRRMEQLIYGVIQEYSAYIAYSSVAAASEDPILTKLLTRIARDEMRHCRFFQLSLESLVEYASDAERELIWPQFRTFFKNFQMPQEFIEMFTEYDMGTDLYTKFWTSEYRSKMVLYLTHYFEQYRNGGTPKKHELELADVDTIKML
jgi:hypothetical protein